jgi:hypothetical protein
LKRTAAFILAIVLFAAPNSDRIANARTDLTAPADAAASKSAAAVAAWYRALDTATIDAYFASRLLDPATAGKSSQRCLRTDNTVSTRASVLANPPLSEAAIAQRRYLIEALAAYGIAVASRASGKPPLDTELALNDARKAAWNLGGAARQHAAGDLFIEDLAAAFAGAVNSLANAPGKAALQQRTLKAKPVIAKLLTIANADVAARRGQALNAARLDYEAWLRVYDARRALATKGAAARTTAAPIPRCFEPVLASNDAPLVARDVAADRTAFPGRESIVARLRAAQDRYGALKNANIEALLTSVSDLNATALTAVGAPADSASAEALHAALSRFRAAAQGLATAVRPLQ